MNDLKQMAALTALNNMFQKGWFDICTVKDVAKMLNVNPECEALKVLAPLHCVHFDVMPTQLRDSIPGLIQECLKMDRIIYQFTMVKEIPAGFNTVENKTSFFKRLRLGGSNG